MQLASAPSSPKPDQVGIKLSPMLAECFFALASYAQHSIQRALGNTLSPPNNDDAGPSVTDLSQLPSHRLAELDVMLPKACEALVLVTQCIITITLGEAGSQPTKGSPSPEPKSEKSPTAYFNKCIDNRGVVESLIGKPLQCSYPN